MVTPVLNESQIKTVERLAQEIWREHYTPIIGSEQVEYMLDRFQSKDAIAKQISSGYLYFLIEAGKDPIGYLALEARAGELFLSKIYVRSALRGQGYGRGAVELSQKIAREKGLPKIVLTVNKQNVHSIAAYEKLGFRKTATLVQDIGNGFVMDDFKMEKET